MFEGEDGKHQNEGVYRAQNPELSSRVAVATGAAGEEEEDEEEEEEEEEEDEEEGKEEEGNEYEKADE
ncbi:hypothetical protein SprV_0501738700 [Sparganum proliferum]